MGQNGVKRWFSWAKISIT